MILQATLCVQPCIRESDFRSGSASAFRDFTSEGRRATCAAISSLARRLPVIDHTTMPPVASSLGLEDAHAMTGEGYDRLGAVEHETIAMQQVDIILTGARSNCVIGED